MKEHTCFKDPEHQKLYSRLYNKTDIDHRNREVLVALYTLAATRKDIEKYVNCTTIDFKALFQDASKWSTSEKALVKLAATLYNSNMWSVTISDVFNSFDAKNTKVALEALRIRYLT